MTKKSYLHIIRPLVLPIHCRKTHRFQQINWIGCAVIWLSFNRRHKASPNSRVVTIAVECFWWTFAFDIKHISLVSVTYRLTLINKNTHMIFTIFFVVVCVKHSSNGRYLLIHSNQTPTCVMNSYFSALVWIRAFQIVIIERRSTK